MTFIVVGLLIAFGGAIAIDTFRANRKPQPQRYRTIDGPYMRYWRKGDKVFFDGCFGPSESCMSVASFEGRIKKGTLRPVKENGRTI